MPELEFLHLAHKPDGAIAYHFVPNRGRDFEDALLVFLNGLGLPQSSWLPVIDSLLEDDGPAPYPAMLAYDRFGQGSSDKDPLDQTKDNPAYGHDAEEVVRDLSRLIASIASSKTGGGAPRRLIFVCNSIGCVLARLYAHLFPRTVCAMLFLDSNMANSDFVSIWPDPDAEGFDPSTLPEGVTPDLLRETRMKYGQVFHPNTPNSEGLDRRNIAHLLPRSDGPLLVGTDGEGPVLTVVEHDWDAFAEQSFNSFLKTPKVMTMEYTNPVWHQYNMGLTKITQHGRSEGPITAKGCGHFIQKDDPGQVAQFIWALLSRLPHHEA